MKFLLSFMDQIIHLTVIILISNRHKKREQCPSNSDLSLDNANNEK